ncbi:type B 50S ribosomal protein L31 [Gordonia sp. VNK1]|jgi:large subunit ribosomal protein L31|uniref:type B 50S ribosomal protein L31 n=1 Tax=Gordonia oleivorans TaxID=3156618 RepID=UPI0032B50ED5
MKPGIHPDYHPVVFRDASTGKQFLTRSTIESDISVEWSDGNTYPLVVVDVTSDSHPFWTGAARLVDTAGRVERFRRRYADIPRHAPRGGSPTPTQKPTDRPE